MDVSGTVGRYMAIIVLAAAVLAFVIPDTGLWIQTKWINYLLMIVMFGMGLTIRPADFKVLFTRPKHVIIGCLAQFTIMPLAAYLLCKISGSRRASWLE
jgi:BASS family bile acid:Na+ symporter